MLVRQREEKDIWQGLYEFVQSESKVPVAGDDFINSESFEKLTKGNYKILSTGIDKQELTHQTIHAFFVRMELKKLPSIPGYTKVSKKQLAKMAFPKLLQNRIC